MHRSPLALLVWAPIFIVCVPLACANGGGDALPGDAAVDAKTDAPGVDVADTGGGEDAPLVGCGAAGAACCIGGACLEGLSCISDRCVAACGAVGQSCCAGNKCSDDGVCTGGTCKAPTDCGAEGKACCASGVCVGALVCTSGVCSKPTTCGTAGAACCAGSACSAGLQCTGGTCVACGGGGQPCCAGSSCSAGSTCDLATTRCNPCGGVGQSCCSGSSCSGGAYCYTGSCFANPTVKAVYSEGGECADLGISHPTNFSHVVIKGRPSAAITQFYRHMSCGDAFASRPNGSIDATGNYVEDIGNTSDAVCNNGTGGRWEAYFTIDGVATPHYFGTYYNSRCPSPFGTCTGSMTFCP